MSKKRGWYGRPNPPPLGWEASTHPVMRHVTGHADDLSQAIPTDSSHTADVLTSVTLPNPQWVRVLKMLTVYGQAHGDVDWQQWRKQVRKAVLLAVNPNTDESRPAVVALPLEDWRTLFRCVRQVCVEGSNDEWRRWFLWLSHNMSEQIRSQVGRQ